MKQSLQPFNPPCLVLRLPHSLSFHACNYNKRSWYGGSQKERVTGVRIEVLKREKEKKKAEEEEGEEKGERDERESDSSPPEVGSLIYGFQFKQDLRLESYNTTWNTIYTSSDTLTTMQIWYIVLNFNLSM